MKKALALFLIILFLLPPKVFSQGNSTEEKYKDLLSKYSTYKSILQKYNVAKSKYLAYGSVISQAEYLEAAKSLVEIETISVFAYTNVVRSRLAEAESVLTYRSKVFQPFFEEEYRFVSTMSGKISDISTLGTLDDYWRELEMRYLAISSYGWQTKSYIEIGSFLKTWDNIKIVREKIDLFLTDNPLNSSEIKAARDKLKLLDNSVSEIDKILNSAIEKYEKNSQAKSNSNAAYIWLLIEDGLKKAEKLVSEYENIVTTILKE